jgi:hypothetical protein
MRNFLILILAMLIVPCGAVSIPFNALDTNAFDYSIPNNTVTINTNNFPTSSNINEEVIGLQSNLVAGIIPVGLATNVSGVLTNSFSVLASAPAIAQYNPILWLNPRAVVTTNNLFGVTSVVDSSGNGNTFYNDPTAAAPIYSQTGFGGYPCWLMQANWNRSSGAVPTVFYALTNATVWGQVLNTSNFLIVDTFQDTLEANNNFTNNGVKLAGPPFLFSVGNNVQFFEEPAQGASSGFSASMQVSVCGGTLFPLLRHGYTPNVTCLQVINGVASFWIDGVKGVTPISTQSGPQTSTGTGFTIGNANSSGSLFLSGHAAFCGNQSDFLIFSNVVPDSGVKAMSDYLMKANGIRGGTAVNLNGDSIMIGSFSTSGISNFLGLVQYYNPNTFVSDLAISGANSGQVLGYLTNNAGSIPYGTGNAINPWLEMVNDIDTGVSLATFETHTTNAMNYVHSLGQKFDLCTQFSFDGETGGSFTRAQGNAFIYSLTNNPYPNRPDAIIDMASDPLMGTNGSWSANTSYYASTGSGIHPNAAGYYELYMSSWAPVLQAQLSSAGGSWNGNFIGNGSGLTNVNASSGSGTFSGNGGGITNIYQSSITAPYNVGPLYIEEDVPLTEFSTIAGNAPTSTGQTPSPYFTQPYLTAFTPPSTLGKYTLAIPQWTTNVVMRVQYQYSGGTNVFWTNDVETSTVLPVSGSQGTFSTTTFTISTNNYTYVFFTNSIQSTIGTNCVKQISSFPGLFATVPTNIQNQISITGVHLWLKGYYDGSNW